MKNLSCILLVDDDYIANHINKLLLEELEIANEIVVKESGEEALSYLVENCKTAEDCCPHLVFLDINMPGMDGFEVLEALEENSSISTEYLKVVLLTSSSNKRDLDRAKNYNIIGYIDKPLTKEKIKEALKEANTNH